MASMYPLERLTHHFHFLPHYESTFCLGLGKIPLLTLNRGSPGGLSGQVGGKCDIMTQEKMFWNRQNSVVTLWTPMLAMVALPGLGHALIHSLIQLTVSECSLSQSLFSVGGWAPAYTCASPECFMFTNTQYLLSTISFFEGLYIFYVYILWCYRQTFMCREESIWFESHILDFHHNSAFDVTLTLWVILLSSVT